MEARYEDANAERVLFHVTAEALCWLRKTFVLLRIAEVKKSLFVNCGAVEGMLGGAVTVMIWMFAESGVGAGEALVGPSRTEVSKPRRLDGR